MWQTVVHVEQPASQRIRRGAPRGVLDGKDPREEENEAANGRRANDARVSWLETDSVEGGKVCG